MKRASRAEEGQTFVEYALILTFISVGLVVVLGLYGNKLVGIYSTIASTVGSTLP